MNINGYITITLLSASLASGLSLAPSAEGASFRCGTRVVIIGDSISRLLRSCGQPALKYKARETIRENGRRQTTGVTHWLYERGRRKNMIVSVRSGRVVRIHLE
jgi:hypothetical protein